MISFDNTGNIQVDFGMIALSLLLTAFFYGLFPLITSLFVIKKPISGKKITLICFVENFFVSIMVFYLLFSGKVLSSAYVLWSFIYAWVCKRILENKGLLETDVKKTYEEKVAWYKNEYKDYTDDRLKELYRGVSSKEIKDAIKQIQEDRINNQMLDKPYENRNNAETYSKEIDVNECKIVDLNDDGTNQAKLLDDNVNSEVAEETLDINLLQTEIRFCKECGFRLQENSNYCGKCGFKVK